MFISNDLRMLIKAFTITTLVIGMYFPIVTIDVDVESTDSSLNSFEDEYLVIYTNKISQASIDDSNDQVTYEQIEENTLLSLFMLLLVIITIVVLGGSLYANFMEREPKFFGEWQSTVVGYISFALLFFIIFLKVFLLESDISSENNRSLFKSIQTSRGNVSFYMNIKESIFFLLMQISLVSYVLLPFSNKVLVERK